MKGVKKTGNGGSGSVKIFPDIHKLAIDYCREQGIKVSYFVTQAVKEKLQKDKK